MATAQYTSQTTGWKKQGVALLRHGHCIEALNLFQQALAIDPDDGLTNYNAGVACHTMHNYAQAINYYQLVIEHNPKFIEAHHNIAQSYAAQRRFNRAVNSYKTALSLDPYDFKSAYNLSLIHHKMGHSQKAISACISTIQAKPDFADAFSTLGMLYREQGHLEEALVCLEQALRINPDLAQAYYEIGVIFNKMGEYENSLDQYQKAMQGAPKFAPALWLYRLSLPMIYDTKAQIKQYRRRFQSNLTQLIESVPLQSESQKQFALTGIETTTNFYLQYQCRNDLSMQRQYGQFVHNVMAANYPKWFINKQMPGLSPGKPIRIGYVSTFMHNHTIGTFLAGWLTNHNHKDFEIHAYHVGKKIDSMTKKIGDHSHFFHHLPGDMETAASQIEKDQLHMLVFTDIGMDPLTTQLAALRLAPIQCKGWGHPVTTGLPNMDYYLSSDLMEPHNADEYYSEALVRLPNLALCYERPTLPSEPKTKETLGLPTNRFIYLSTQSIFKYLPQHDDLYPRIALEVPDACFVFIRNQSDHATRRFRQRIESAFNAYDLDATKFCYYIPRLSYADFLSLNMAADVLLDSLEWSGGKTTLEALSCGLPVVTFPGRFMRGRHAYAMLLMLRITDTIADSKTSYCALASRLANDPVFYRNVHQKISSNQHRLYNDRLFIEALEKFYKEVVRQQLASELL